MSLRVKVELILFVFIIAVVGLGYGAQRFIVLPALIPLEEQAARKAMTTFEKEVEKHGAILEKSGEEWSLHPELAQAIAGRDNAALNAMLSIDEMKNGKLSVVYVLDAEQNVLASKSIDLATGTEVVHEGLAPDRLPNARALLGTDPGSKINGVIWIAAGPMLVSSTPVFVGAGQSTPVGRLIVGSLLTHRYIASNFDNAAIGVEMLPVGDTRLSQDEKNLLPSMSAAKGQYVSQVTDEQIRAYSAFPGVPGSTGFMLRMIIYRSVMTEANNALRSGLLVQVGIGLVALVLLIVMFRRTVLDPLSKLTNHVVAVAESNDLSSRLRLERTDELGSLGREFDRMVGELEQDRERQKRDAEALRESEERYILAVRGANDGLWDWNLKSNEVHYSTRWKSMLGHEENEIGTGIDEWFRRIHPEDRENVKAALDAHLNGQSAHFESEHRMITKNRDTYLWVLCRGLAVRDTTGEATRMAGSLSDITLRKLFEEQLSHLALHDPLTALPNRTLLLDRISQSLKHAQRNPDYLFAVLFLDLDRFKVVNDGLGHVIGDRLLTAVAERINAALRDEDTLSRSANTVSRFGGDEFAVLLDRLTALSDATLIAERVQAKLRAPFHIDDHEIFTTSTIGIALSEAGYQSAEEVLRNADTAMFRAKAAGKDRFAIFDSDMGAKAIARVQLENDLRRAVERKDFLVYYQPIVSLTTGKVEAVEALVRWQHPETGIVPPIEFIPLAEETGMIVPIGDWVLLNACRQTRAWQVKIPYAERLSINVNLSVLDFSTAGLADRVESRLLETGLSARHLELEVTEGAIIDSIDTVTTVLKKLRDLSVQLAIDDFGTGYSSLSYLHRFPMNTLKIDRAFVRDLGNEPECLHIVKTILLLAQSLRVGVVAEGIEDKRQLHILRELGCGLGQGYYFSKPLDADACGKLLASEPKW